MPAGANLQKSKIIDELCNLDYREIAILSIFLNLQPDGRQFIYYFLLFFFEMLRDFDLYADIKIALLIVFHARQTVARQPHLGAGFGAGWNFQAQLLVVDGRNRDSCPQNCFA